MVTRFANYFVFVLITFFSIHTFSQTYTPPPNSPLANQEHPRLFFTHNSLQSIKNYINSYDAADFQTYINAVDAAYSEAPSGKGRNYLLLDATNFAFLSYAVHSGFFNNYNFAHTAGEYAQKAYAHAAEIRQRVNSGMKEQSHGNILASDGQGGYLNLTLGAVYDWCYDYLSLSQKQTIADAIIASYNDRDKDVGPGEYIKLGLSILSQCHHVGVGGLAMWGDALGSQYSAKVQEMLDGIQWLWIDRIFKMGEHMLENTAGWSEGPDYFAGSCSHLSWYAAAMSSAINQNLFQDYNWLHDIPKYLYFYLFPMYINGMEPGFYEQRNDAASLRAWGGTGTLQQMTTVLSFIKTTDPLSAGFYKWILEESEYKFGNNDPYDAQEPRLYWLFYKFLWGYKDVANKTPSQAGIQTSYRFGQGDAILKSDLTTQNATKINFYTPKYHLPRHAHQESSSFIIFKYGNLALDAGVSKNGSNLPKSDGSGTPIYHNLLGTYLPGQNPRYQYHTNINDNADAYYDADNQPGGDNHVGNVKALRFEPGIFDYIEYDYTRAYKGESYANRMRRTMLYIRDPNAPNYTNQEYLLVFDYADLTTSNIKRRWLLHTPSAPEIVGGSWNPVSNGFWTANSGSVIKVSSTYANTHGRLFLKILSPSSYQLRLRGGNNGSSYYWFTDAEGNDLTERGPFNDWGAFWAGTHRLEIEDQSGTAISKYLTVMQIGDANSLTSMASVQKLETVKFIGAFINGDRVAFFNRTVSPEGLVHYNINSNKTVRHFVTGLIPADYEIRKDGVLLHTITVDDDGTLYFEHPGGGNFLIDSGLTGGNWDDPVTEGFALHQNYPNPFNPSTTITYSIPQEGPVKLTVIDLSGKKVQTLVNEPQNAGTHDIYFEAGQSLASGLYFYRLETSGFAQTRKMILLK
jgi:hypothetical protein